MELQVSPIVHPLIFNQMRISSESNGSKGSLRALHRNSTVHGTVSAMDQGGGGPVWISVELGQAWTWKPGSLAV